MLERTRRRRRFMIARERCVVDEMDRSLTFNLKIPTVKTGNSSQENVLVTTLILKY
jgi:hypothetical protein